MADILGYEEDRKQYSEILDRGKKSYEEKLWNGEQLPVAFAAFKFEGLDLAKYKARQ
jgi:hypothetical protein